MKSFRDMVFTTYREYAQEALAEYEQAELKTCVKLGNHKFKLPEELNVLYDNPFVSDYDRVVHGEIDSLNKQGEPAALASLLGQQKFFPGDWFKQQIDEYFGFDYSFVAINSLMPGQMTCTHVDRTRSLFVNNGMPEEYAERVMPEDYQRILVFIEDQRRGEFFQTGEEMLTWKAGDIIRMPWYLPHATANCGDKNRYLISIAGVSLS